jgi:lysylphosphatidylglycerol synthetase-like protein (DUF2156 family)
MYLVFSAFALVAVNTIVRLFIFPTSSFPHNSSDECPLVYDEARALRMLFAASVVPSSLILFTLMMEAMRSSETSVLTRTTLHHILGDRILQLFLCSIILTFIRDNADVRLITITTE